jgi:hypothetical protein
MLYNVAIDISHSCPQFKNIYNPMSILFHVFLKNTFPYKTCSPFICINPIKTIDLCMLSFMQNYVYKNMKERKYICLPYILRSKI